MIHLDDHWLNIVRDYFRKHVPRDCQVWVFGSRVSGKHKKFSDLDIALIYDKPLSPQALLNLEEALDESALPIKVDVVEFYKASPEFQQIIKQHYEVLELGL